MCLWDISHITPSWKQLQPVGVPVNIFQTNPRQNTGRLAAKNKRILNQAAADPRRCTAITEKFPRKNLPKKIFSVCVFGTHDRTITHNEHHNCRYRCNAAALSQITKHTRILFPLQRYEAAPAGRPSIQKRTWQRTIITAGTWIRKHITRGRLAALFFTDINQAANTRPATGTILFHSRIHSKGLCCCSPITLHPTQQRTAEGPGTLYALQIQAGNRSTRQPGRTETKHGNPSI